MELMTFDSHPDKREEIYISYLQEIVGIKFTLREVDVIACILHNRGDKKIADVLGIAYRTVGVHVRNILIKLSYNSREGIIDAIEKSGKLPHLRQYYFHLIIRSSFKKHVQKIGALINRSGITYSIDLTEVTSEEEKILKRVTKSLALANIILLEHKEVSYNFYILGKSLPTKQQQANDNKATNINNIALLFDGNIDLPEVTDFKCIDFKHKADYYFAVFKLIELIIDKPALKPIIQEFHDKYESSKNSLQGNVISLSESGIVRKLSNKVKLVVVMIVALLTLPVVYSYNQPKEELISELERLMVLSKKGNFSSNNITKTSMNINYSLAKQVEEILNRLHIEKINSWFENNNLPSDKLVDYVHTLHALSNYYTHNEHDGEKARKILSWAKALIEGYVSKRSNIQIDFGRLGAEELYSELAVIKDLPEIYTRIMYLLARTYVYQGDRNEAIRYFEISKQLGNKLGLFQGYLSDANGLEIIRKDKINILIENGEFEQAKKNLFESINLYKQFKTSNFKYKISYTPNAAPKIITIKENTYATVECSERIMQHYSKLISITEDLSKKKEYLQEIETQLFGDNSSVGILLVLKNADKLKNLSNRKIASIYNSIGNVFLSLMDEDIDYTLLKEVVIRELALNNNDNAEMIKQIFMLAKSNSRNNDYTKADSYDGLIKIQQKQIDLGLLTKEQEIEAITLIDDLKNKRDDINKALKRNQT